MAFYLNLYTIVTSIKKAESEEQAKIGLIQKHLNISWQSEENKSTYPAPNNSVSLARILMPNMSDEVYI